MRFRVLLSALVLHAGTWAQSGQVDPTFNAHETDTVGYGPHNTCLLIQPLSNGLLALTNPALYNGINTPALTYIQENGVRDTSYLRGNDTDDAVWGLTELSDGGLVIGGAFTLVAGHPCERIAKIGVNGILDTTFADGLGANDGVHRIVECADGKLIIVGSFTSYGGVARNKIARLHADGTLDLSYDPGTGCNADIQNIVMQPDGKVVIAGNFSSYNGINVGRIARLDTNAVLDTTFSTQGVSNGNIWCLMADADGKFMIGGSFYVPQDQFNRGIVRLNADGTDDTSFNPGLSANNDVNVILRTADGKYIVGGRFTSFDGEDYEGLVRLEQDGSVDTSFGPGGGQALDAGIVVSAVLLPNGAIRATGQSRSPIEGHFRPNILALTANGGWDPDFGGATGFNAPPNDILVQPDGRILVAGEFLAYNGEGTRSLLRLMPDGEVDGSFEVGTGFDGFFNDEIFLARQPDGRIIAAGRFNSYAGIERNGVVRIHADGSIDTSLDPDYGASSIQCLALQPDGKIILGGGFNTFDYQPYRRVVRLNSNGTIDTSFDPGSGVDGTVRSIHVLPDGDILIAGSFYNYNGTEMRGIARLNADGSLDTSFSSPLTHFGQTCTVKGLPDGRILLSGHLVMAELSQNRPIIRMMPDGSVDGSFDAGTDNTTVHSMIVQPDGRILLAGLFNTFNGHPARGVVRLEPNGEVDQTFDVSTGAAPWSYQSASFVDRMALQGPNVIISGPFVQFGGYPRHGIARLLLDMPTSMPSLLRVQLLALPNPSSGLFHITLQDPSWITVRDIHGRIIHERYRTTGQSTTLDLGMQPAGVYLVQVEDGSGMRTTRLVKQ